MRKYEYPRAGLRAPPGVRAAIERWRHLPVISSATDKTQIPLLYYLLGTGTGPFKMSKQDAAYQSAPVHKQSCRTCSSCYEQVVTSDVICSQIEGAIELDGWCRLWNCERG